MSEVWKPITGADGYEASSLGNIRSWRSNGGNLRKSPKLIKCRAGNGHGYLMFLASGGAKRRLLTVHRCVLVAFAGPLPFAGAVCRHMNGDKADNRAENLAWGTREENEADKERHGTKLYGTAVYGAKLTDEQVQSIRMDPRRQIDIAREYGIGQQHVSKIKLGQCRIQLKGEA